MDLTRIPKKFVRDILDSIICLKESDIVLDAVNLFANGKVSIVPILNGDLRLVGVFTKSNLFKMIINNQELNEPVGKHMKREVSIVDCDEPIEEVFHRLPTTKVGQFVVVDKDNKVKGVLAHINLVRSLLETTGSMTRELETIIDGMHNGLIVTNELGEVSLINHAACKMFNTNQQEVISRRIDEVFPGTQCSYTLTKIIQSGETRVGDKDIINSVTVIESYSPIFQGTHIIGAICIFQDMTQLDHLGKKLQSYKKLYETLKTVLDVGYDCIVVTNCEGAIEWCNGPFADFIGRPKKNLMGQGINALIKNDDIKTAIKRGESFKSQLMSGEGKISIIICRPIYVDGVVEGAVVKIIFKEIDELKDIFKRIDVLEKKIRDLPNEAVVGTGARFTMESIVGENRKIKVLKQKIDYAARSNSNILLRGESGTGKELFAHAIHNCSYRFHGPFIKVNCAAIPENLLESEFFGCEDGAFTGAKTGGKPGKFQLATGGTIFLDEIGDMSSNLQAKLLRVLEDNEITPVGATKATKVDVRVVVSTNRNLGRMIDTGQFRLDLYYRLNVVSIKIPPLRERKDDIPVLVDFLLKKFSRSNNKSLIGISMESLALLQAYFWPGNVRELENVVERAVSLNTSGLINPGDLPDDIKGTTQNLYSFTDSVKRPVFKHKIQEADKEFLIQELKAAGGNKTKAAKNMGISRTALYDKLKSYRLK